MIKRKLSDSKIAQYPCPLVKKNLGFIPNSIIYHPKKQNPSVKHQGNFSLTSRKKDQICQTFTKRRKNFAFLVSAEFGKNLYTQQIQIDMLYQDQFVFKKIRNMDFWRSCLRTIFLTYRI